MKIKILIPVYNDWQSVSKLINEINYLISNEENEVSIIIVNDASNHDRSNEDNNLENIHSFKILNMKLNQGHARCIATGLKYIYEKEDFDYVIPMDGDGEDRPEEIKSLVKKIKENPNLSVVAKRVKRSEGIFFQSLYQLHKLITIIFTGQNVNFGNYCLITRSDVEKLHSKASLWSSFSGSVKKNLKIFNEINSIRGSRYFGPSQMSLFKLIIHSLSIMAVFKYDLFLRSSFMLIILAYLNSYLGNLTIFFQVLIVIFNLMIFIVSFREQEKDLLNCHNNLNNIKKVTH